MQGVVFLHNCSRDSRSLWKWLDRLLVNDCWLGTWPNTSYVCLNARTSDHSPLVLRGDNAGRKASMFRLITILPSPWSSSRLCGEFGGIVFTDSFSTGQAVSDFTTPGILLWLNAGPQKRIFQITDSGGQVLTEQQDVINEFIAYYQNLLGGTRRDRVLDLCYLRPWARHILSEAEGLTLVQPVTPSEIKQAVFDIDEVRAPGPDGYSSSFFKAAWPVIGRRAVHWGYILLAQELFHGYNQQHLPPRCALKVDLRKAYDTVEWDFLNSTLTLFGFPAQFISWIEECVTTLSFSVCLNGSPHGYSRGVRDYGREILCPHSFVLVMELFQLGFADDLLLLSRADSSRSYLTLILRRVISSYLGPPPLFGIHSFLFWVIRKVTFPF
ncbi:UNVERIFIED_CONTAM: hypothetical protein Slati_2741300, partial [Sesamum latifolium]